MRGAALNDGADMDGAVIESDVPARMDRLPWSRWHVRIIVALGTSWILDGLEVTLVGSLSGVLQTKNGLSLTDQQVTGAATVYLAGAVIGALLFGRLTDRHGRRRLFLVTLATYSIATLGTAFAVNYLSFAIARFVTGMGIGGEYAAINSAVDELIPGKIRGRVDLFVNATFWVGASLGAVATLLLLSSHGPPHAWGWRLAFGIGGVLGFGVLILRLAVPESPRWLMLRGRERDASAVVDAIESEIREHIPELPAVAGETAQAQDPRPHALGRDFPAHARPEPQPIGPRAGAHGGTGVFLQCDVLHLRPRRQAVLSSQRCPVALAALAVCHRQLSRARNPRTVLRSDRTQAHDHRLLCVFRGSRWPSSPCCSASGC